MRNIFDQYEQPENKLTHAVFTALDQDRTLLRSLLKRLELHGAPAVGELRLVEQQIPGVAQQEVEGEQRGLPDACLYHASGWAVLFECKVQARVQSNQLRRHLATARRYDFEDPHLVVISVDPTDRCTPGNGRALSWREIYSMFRERMAESFWARQVVEYMHVFESKMLDRQYSIRGTITVFDGLCFDDDHPYTYREGKRLLKLLCDELQSRADLHKIGVDPHGSRRTAITGRHADHVWDYLPLQAAREAGSFTDHPHVTVGIRREWAKIAVTVPNGVKGGFRNKLAALGRDGFLGLVHELEQRLEPVVEKSPGAKPMLNLAQRHYRGRRSAPIIDARIEADLRTARTGKSGGVKHQPQWFTAIYELLVRKKSNLQLALDMRFSYDCPLIRSRAAVDLFAESCRAFSPFLELLPPDDG